MLFDALNEVAYTTSAVTREMFPSGSTSSFGISQNQQEGLLIYDDEHIVDGWTSAQRARYIGESGFARFDETHEGGNTGYAPAVDAALYAAYANRLLGENWCESAVDGGAIITRTEMLQRAEEWFTTAIEAASTSAFADQKTAAYAGRASVRANLGDWAGAICRRGAGADVVRVRRPVRDGPAGPVQPHLLRRRQRALPRRDRLEHGVRGLLRPRPGIPRTPWTYTRRGRGRRVRGRGGLEGAVLPAAEVRRARLGHPAVVGVRDAAAGGGEEAHGRRHGGRHGRW